MKIHLCVAVAVVVAGLCFRIDAQSWIALIVCIALVMAFECMNTAIEAVVDLVSPEYHIIAKHAKDCAAGAALVCAVASVFVGALVFLPLIVSAL